MQIVYCLAHMGADVFFVSDGKEPLYRYSRYIREYTAAPFPLDPQDTEFFEWFKEHICQKRIDVVCGSDIYTTRLTERISKQLHNVIFLPIADIRTIDLLDNKWTFFQLLNNLHLPVPETIRIDDWTARTQEKTASLSYPVVVKPLALSGGRGVIRFDTIDQIDGHLRGLNRYKELPLLVQTYFGNKDIGLGFMADSGRLVVHHVQIKDDRNAKDIQFLDHAEVLRIGKRIVSETGYSGPGFIDMRLDEHTKQIRVLEFNPRLWASVALALWQGCNYLEAGVRLAYGLNANQQSRCRPGTFYSLGSLWSQRTSGLRKISRGNLYGIWMQKTDILAQLYRLLRRIRHRRRSRGQPVLGSPLSRRAELQHGKDRSPSL